MGELRDRMIRQMRLRRLAESTQEGYLHAMDSLVRYYRQPPDGLTDHQIQAYIIHLFDERRLAWSSCNVYVAGLQFFYGSTLGRVSVRFAIPPRRSEQKLPEILSAEEVQRLFTVTENLKHRTLLETTYSAGLRASELVHLKISSIDSDRMTIRVEHGKGNKDRYTTLSHRLLEDLRAYWRRYRPQLWLFPGRDPRAPMHRDTALTIFHDAKRKAGIRKAGGIHSLRHAFATHLLEAGVDIRTIQLLLGHRSVLSTTRYLQLTRKKLGSTQDLLDLLAIPNPVQLR